MKNLVLYVSVISLFISCQTSAQNKKTQKKYKVEKTAEEWKKALTPMQYYVLREAGTERPNTSKFTYFKEKGTFVVDS